MIDWFPGVLMLCINVFLFLLALFLLYKYVTDENHAFCIDVYTFIRLHYFSTTLSDYKATKPVRQFVGGINDRKLLLQACQGVSCVIHIAGIIDVSMFPDEQKLKRVNVQGRYLN